MASCQRLWPVPGSSPSGLNGSTSITCSSGIALLLQAYAAFSFSISCSYKAGSGATCLQQRFEAPELALYQLFEHARQQAVVLTFEHPPPMKSMRTEHGSATRGVGFIGAYDNVGTAVQPTTLLSSQSCRCPINDVVEAEFKGLRI